MGVFENCGFSFISCGFFVWERQAITIGFGVSEDFQTWPPFCFRAKDVGLVHLVMNGKKATNGFWSPGLLTTGMILQVLWPGESGTRVLTPIDKNHQLPDLPRIGKQRSPIAVCCYPSLKLVSSILEHWGGFFNGNFRILKWRYCTI